MFERDTSRATTTRDLTQAEGKSASDDPGSGSSVYPAPTIAQRVIGRFIHGWFWRSLAVAAEVGIAFFLRELVAYRDPKFAPFITFYPVVLLASLLDGVWAGMAVTVLSTLVAEIWIFPPQGHLGVADPYDTLSLAIFFTFGISLSIVAELYHRNREKLAAYLVDQAVSEERGIAT